MDTPEGAVEVMPWMTVDDQMHGHRKFVKLGHDRLAATGLWVTAGSWAAAALTDGFVPDYVVMQWDPDESLAKRLVAVGLWSDATADGETGYQFHDWTTVNRSREEIEQSRADARNRQRRSRDRRRQADGTLGPDPGPDGPNGGGVSRVTEAPVTRDVTCDVTPDVTRDSHGSHPVSHSTPLPSPPPPTKEKTSSSLSRATRVASDPPGFAEFWDACPRKVGKDAARRSYAKALKRATPEQLRDRMTAAAVFWRRSRTEDRYIPHPATWLNQGRYEDPEPDNLPAVVGGNGPTGVVGFAGGSIAPSGRVPTTTQRVADIARLSKEMFGE